MTIEQLISVVAIVLSGIATISSVRRGSKTDTKAEASQLTTVIVKLENIGNDISEIKSDMRDVKTDIKDHESRIVKLEQQVKVLNHTIFDDGKGGF